MGRAGRPAGDALALCRAAEHLEGAARREGRAWLRRALERDPHHCAASAYLAAAESPRDGGHDLRLPRGC